MTRSRKGAELLTAYESGGLSQFKNRIINGAMMIDQRNAGASTTISAAGTSNAYVVDRFWFNNGVTSGTWAVQRSSTAPTGYVNSVSITNNAAVTAAATENARFWQPIEGFNCADLAWGTASAAPVTLSFWVRSSLTGTYSGGLMNNNVTRSYVFTYTINSANTWEQKTITVPGDTTGTWTVDNSVGIYVAFDLGSGSNKNGTANTWNGSYAHRTSGSINWVGTNGATFYITGVQLEKGSTATSFDYRPYGTELALCQRYYETSYPAGTAVGQPANAAVSWRSYSQTSGYIHCTTAFKVVKRALPTCQCYDQSGNAGKIGINDNVSDPENQNSSPNSITTNGCGFGSNGYNCNGIRWNYTASAEL